jgi:hypothetical protein
MTDETEPDAKSAGSAEERVRKPWHAPQFVIADVAATDVVCNAGNDGPLVS